VGVAAALGPTLGGLIVGVAGWRAVFAANIPVIALALLFSWRAMPRGSGRREAARAGRVRLRVTRPFAAATSGVALSNLAFYTTLIATPILLHEQARWGSIEIGLALTAMSGPTALMAPVGGRLADSLGRRWPAVVGHAVAAAGLLPLVAGGTDRPAVLLPLLAVAGTGFGLATATLQTSAVEAVPAEQAGLAAGLFSTSRYVGSIAGSLVLSAVLVTGAGHVAGFTTLAAVVAAGAVLAALVSLGLRGHASVERPSTGTG
jgi:predicted MFS family arabinose efflux permease